MVQTRGKNVAVLVSLGMLWAAPSLAEGTDCFSYGYEDPGRSVNGPITLGMVKAGAPRINFLKTSILKAGCPSMDSACRDKAFLVPGDDVVIIGTKGDYVCAAYVSKQGRITDGWLPKAAIATVHNEAPTDARGWLGRWRSGPEQTIVIGEAGKTGLLSIKGDATWGASDPERVRRGAVNIGSLEGEATAQGAVISFGMGEDGTLPFDQADEADCKVRMERLGPYLLVKDNNMCGGMNVTFTSIYRRAE